VEKCRPRKKKSEKCRNINYRVNNTAPENVGQNVFLQESRAVAREPHIFCGQWNGPQNASESTENRRFTPGLQGTPANFYIKFISHCEELESFGYNFAADSMRLSSFKFLW